MVLASTCNNLFFTVSWLQLMSADFFHHIFHNSYGTWNKKTVLAIKKTVLASTCNNLFLLSADFSWCQLIFFIIYFIYVWYFEQKNGTCNKKRWYLQVLAITCFYCQLTSVNVSWFFSSYISFCMVLWTKKTVLAIKKMVLASTWNNLFIHCPLMSADFFSSYISFMYGTLNQYNGTWQ